MQVYIYTSIHNKLRREEEGSELLVYGCDTTCATFLCGYK